MGETLEADFNDTAFRLTLIIDSITSGPIPGQSPTVAVRLAPTINSYLDWGRLREAILREILLERRAAEMARERRTAEILEMLKTEAVLQAAGSVAAKEIAARQAAPAPAAQVAGELPTPATIGEKLLLPVAMALALAVDGKRKGRSGRPKVVARERARRLAQRGWLRVSKDVGTRLSASGAKVAVLALREKVPRMASDSKAWEAAIEEAGAGDHAFYACPACPGDLPSLAGCPGVLSVQAGAQVVAMAEHGWLRVNRHVAEKLFASGAEIAVMGARDPAKRKPKTYEKSSLSWEAAVQLVEGRRANLPARHRELSFYVRAQ